MNSLPVACRVAMLPSQDAMAAHCRRRSRHSCDVCGSDYPAAGVSSGSRFTILNTTIERGRS